MINTFYNGNAVLVELSYLNEYPLNAKLDTGAPFSLIDISSLAMLLDLSRFTVNKTIHNNMNKSNIRKF